MVIFEFSTPKFVKNGILTYTVSIDIGTIFSESLSNTAL